MGKGDTVIFLYRKLQGGLYGRIRRLKEKKLLRLLRNEYEEEHMGTEEMMMQFVTDNVFGVWFLIGAALVFWMQAGGIGRNGRADKIFIVLHLLRCGFCINWSVCSGVGTR